MPHTNPDDSLLLIRCPSCGQRFKVGEDLRGRTVECGGCEHRFRINDEVIVRGRKFYPGERRDTRLNRFQRVPLAVAPPVTGPQMVRYAEPPDPITFEPASPQRIVAGIVGATGMVCMALLLMFGASRGGILDGMTTEKRLMMAGFTGLLGLAFLVYANPRARGKAILVGLLMAGGLVSLPFFFTAGSTQLGNPLPQEPPPKIAVESEAESAEEDRLSQLRVEIGTKPLDEERERLGGDGAGRTALGIWLRDLREQNRFLVKEHILRAASADPQSHLFPRGNGDFLFVVTGITLSLEELADVAAPLGTVESIHPELSVLEVRVNNQNFVEGPIEKLNDRTDPAFYDLNKRELESIDLERVGKAVRRLTEAEPKVYRSDITRKLIQLLESPGVDFKGDISSALAVWAEDQAAASRSALTQAEAMLAAKSAVPKAMVALIVSQKNPGVIPVIDELWERDPNAWEALYGDMGEAAEETVIRRFLTATDPGHRRSLARILGRVGTERAISVMETGLAGADAELKVLLENSIQTVRTRLGS